jgi:hypothetical protein
MVKGLHRPLPSILTNPLLQHGSTQRYVLNFPGKCRLRYVLKQKPPIIAICPTETKTYNVYLLIRSATRNHSYRGWLRWISKITTSSERRSCRIYCSTFTLIIAVEGGRVINFSCNEKDALKDFSLCILYYFGNWTTK